MRSRHFPAPIEPWVAPDAFVGSGSQLIGEVNILAKLGVSSRYDAIALARERGWLK